MQKFTRSLLLAGAAFGLAACGDDVSITEPTPPPAAVVTGVTVAPADVTINIAQKVVMTAQVAVSAGTGTPNTTVAWSSANASIASVNATSGEVTGVAAGTTTIRATAGGLTGAAGVTVREAPLQVPATVSIQSVTQGATNTPVNLANVAGQIEVTMNINAGSQTLDSVRVRVGNVTGAVQTFSGAPSAPVTLSINTAAYTINADSSATVRFTNGDKVVRAEVFVKGAGATTPAASNTVTFTLNNLDTFHARWTNPTTSALDANGLRWYKGSVTANVIPVMYSGNVVTSVNMGFGTCAAATDGAAPFVQTFACATTEAAGQAPIVNSSVQADGNSGPTGVLGTFANTLQLVAAGGAIRLDNVAPAAPVVFENPNGRQNNWVNDAVSFTTVQNGTTAPNGMIAAAVTDAGVGGVTYTAKAGADLAAALAAANISSPAPLAASLTNGYCLVLYAQDALGNMSAAPTACDAGDADNNTTVGVDRAAPTIAYSGGLASNAKITGASVGTEFQVTVADTGVIGNSGMLAGTPVTATVQLRNPAGTTCLIGTGTTCAQTGLETTGSANLPLVATTTIAAETGNGYYTFNGTAVDAAGNAAAISATRVVILDNVAPALTAASLSLASNFYNGGVSQTFQSLANDNVDVASVNAELNYGVIPSIFLGTTTLNAFNAATLLTSNVPVNVTVPFFYRSVALVATNSPVVAGAQTKPTDLQETLFDQAGNSSGAVTSPFAAASIVAANPAAFANAWSWAVSPSVTTVSRGATTPTAVTLTADLFGPTATFNSPFARVDFYAVDTNGDLRLIGTSSSLSTFDDGSANGRRHRYTFVWTVGADTNFATGTTIYAIGATASGDALATQPTAAMTINP